tara:strand:- start:157 stop:798 length:642 start_codon:yes stop_codon:yes gene_type:complete
MGIKIRLARGGSKKRPFYRVVAADSRMPRDGRFIEKMGTYNPLLPKDNPDRVKLDVEKIQAWIAKGAQLSDRISRLLENLEVLPAKARNNPKKGLKHKATEEREAAKSEKAATSSETEKLKESEDNTDKSEDKTVKEEKNTTEFNDPEMNNNKEKKPEVTKLPEENADKDRNKSEEIPTAESAPKGEKIATEKNEPTDKSDSEETETVEKKLS